MTEELKTQATTWFQQLREAYQANDLQRLREIYQQLKNKGVLATRSSLLTEVESLKAAIAGLEEKLRSLSKEIIQLWESDSYRLILSIGKEEEAWDDHFLARRWELEGELITINEKLTAWNEEAGI